MKRFLALLWQLPLATLAGAGLGVLAALIAVLLSLGPLEGASHPLALFALAPMPAVLGAWLDWARLWRPSPRTRFWSGATLGLTGLACVDAIASNVMGGPTVGLLLAPAVPLAFALLVTVGTRVLLGLARFSTPRLGVALVRGVVRRDELERLVIETRADGRADVIELDRRHPELGPRRSVDLSIGAPVTMLARIREKVRDGDPFRTERRSEATLVLGVASSREALRRAWRARARAWCVYLVTLAIAGAAVTAAACYSPSPPVEALARGLSPVAPR